MTVLSRCVAFLYEEHFHSDALRYHNAFSTKVLLNLLCGTVIYADSTSRDAKNFRSNPMRYHKVFDYYYMSPRLQSSAAMFSTFSGTTRLRPGHKLIFTTGSKRREKGW